MPYLFLVVFLFSNVLGFSGKSIVKKSENNFSFEKKKEKKSPVFQNAYFVEVTLEDTEDFHKKDTFQSLLFYNESNLFEDTFYVFFGLIRESDFQFRCQSKTALYILYQKFLE